MTARRSALALIALTLAGIVSPPVPMRPSAWAEANFVLPDGDLKGQLIKLAQTPHLIEPLDATGPDDIDNEIAVMKCAQSAFTTMLQMSIGHSIDRDPCDMMVVQPTDSALTDFNSQKLGRAIEGSPILLKKVRPQVGRSGTASTTYEKKFPGGALFLALATSSADLRSKTIKKAFCDEIDEYPDDLNDQGDPLDMIKARQISFLRPGTWKRVYISTPTIKGSSKIEAKFEGGDQRHWTMTCPHCGDTNLRFEWGKNFRYNPEPPYEAHYVPPCCGVIIEGWQKFDVYLTGRWVASKPGLGRYKSYFFGGLCAPFVPWDAIAKDACDAGDNSTKLKTFYNLTLGLPYEVKVSLVDTELLLSRRESSVKRGYVAPQALILTAYADIQMRGMWLSTVAHAPNREKWLVDAQYIDGDTADMNGEAWQTLIRETVDREFPDAFGGMRKLDALGIDSGYRTHVVYAKVRQSQRLHPMTGRDVILATKGLQGWGRPPIGQPVLVDINLDGKKIKQGVKVWGIGTWPLKAAHYTDLNTEKLPDQLVYPSGYCHHGDWVDEVYFKQITAETLQKFKSRSGSTTSKWVPHGPNHFLDCAVGNHALFEYLGGSSSTPEQWAALAVARGLPPELSTVDLFTPRKSANVVEIAKAEDAIAKRKSEERKQLPEMSDAARGWLDGYEVKL